MSFGGLLPPFDMTATPPSTEDSTVSPIFALHGPEWSPPPALGAVSAVSIGHNNIFVATQMGKLVRLGAGTGEYEELDMPGAHRSARVTALFADTHTGVALLATLGGAAETIYFYKSKARALGKLKGVGVTAVAWLRAEASAAKADSKAADTREVLIGSSTGTLYEAAIEPQRTKYFRQLHAFHPMGPVLGLTVEAFPSDARLAGTVARWHVLAATPSRLFEFIGGPTLEGVFHEAVGGGGSGGRPAGMPIEQLRDGEAVEHSPSLSLCYRAAGSATAFTWATGAGLFHGGLVFGAARADSAIYDFGRLRYPEQPLGQQPLGQQPLGPSDASSATAAAAAMPMATRPPTSGARASMPLGVGKSRATAVCHCSPATAAHYYSQAIIARHCSPARSPSPCPSPHRPLIRAWRKALGTALPLLIGTRANCSRRSHDHQTALPLLSAARCQRSRPSQRSPSSTTYSSIRTASSPSPA